MPPHSIDAERSVLGAVLLNPDAAGVAFEILREDATDVFYVDAHRHIYGAMLQLFSKNMAIDAVTVMEQLRRDGRLEEAGGASYIGDLTGAVPTSANIEFYARLVLDTAVLRRMIGVCTAIVGRAYEGGSEVSELLDRAEADIFAIAEKRQLNPITKVADLLPEAVERIDHIIKSHSGITGLATGYKRLDEMLSGLQRSDMVVLAARPSVGKTAFALNISRHVAVNLRKAVLIFSLEMAKEQLVQRMICIEGMIDSSRLRTGFLAGSVFPKVQQAAGRLSPAPVYIDDTPNISLLELRSKARRHASQHDVDLIVIDYMQLISAAGRFENRQREMSEISRSIKGLARELRVPVMTLSQLSREAEKDESGTPRLSHLRESGAIEQDADVVLMLSRPPAHESEEQPDRVRVDIAKQRNGPTGRFDLLFNRSMQRFVNLEESTADAVAPPPGGDYGPDYDVEPEDVGSDDIPF